jgi:hypothetical protein
MANNKIILQTLYVGEETLIIVEREFPLEIDFNDPLLMPKKFIFGNLDFQIENHLKLF